MTNRQVPNCRLVNKRFRKHGNTWVIGIPIEEKLDGIINSYLLFNNRSDIVEWTGYKSINSNKPLSLMSKKIQHLTYNMFERFAIASLHQNDFRLDTFLTIYDSVSIVYTKHLKRSRILNRHKQKNVHDFISYYFGLKKYGETNKWIVNAVELICEKISPEYLPLLVLMILEIIPPFGSQIGCGIDKNIDTDNDATRASRFAHEYIDSLPNKPIINETIELSFNKYHYINRLVIIEEFSKCINRCLYYCLILKHNQESTNNNELTNVFRCIKTIRPDGIEIDCKNNVTCFVSAEEYPKVLELMIKDECQVYYLGENIYILIDKINLFITLNKFERVV